MTSYIVALARYHAARRTMARAERNLDRMIEHGVDEDHAYFAPPAWPSPIAAASKPTQKCCEPGDCSKLLCGEVQSCQCRRGAD